MLSVNQTPEELNQIYKDDYYWYLNSELFSSVFLKELGRQASACGFPVLDVGCGCGWLVPHLSDKQYMGIDGSAEAISKAKEQYPQHFFGVSRFEEFETADHYETLVFGNIFGVLVDPKRRVDFIDRYVKMTSAKKFVIYDLACVDFSDVSSAYRLVRGWVGSVDMPDIEEVKRHRQILVYQCE